MKITSLFPILFITSLPIILSAQQWNNHWYFGNFAGLDFSSGTPVGVTGALETLEGSASISDYDGNLLFYTDGITVWNRHHEVMPNGTLLHGGHSSSQSAVIVPLPGSPWIYYVFTVEDHSTDGGLAYSIVDMSLDGGDGDVVASSKNTPVLDRTSEKLAAVLHSNQRDIWIIVHALNTNEFYAFLVTPLGLPATPVISTIGSVYGSDPAFWYTGLVRVSHDGRKIATSLTTLSINELFNFNAATGQLSNRSAIAEDIQLYGMEFSPNDSILYLAMHDYLLDTLHVLQYHYREPIPYYDTIHTSIQSAGGTQYGALQLGPDNKIYVCLGNTNTMDVIHQPNKRGVDCQYEAAAIPLAAGSSNGYGLPPKVVVIECPRIYLGNDMVRCAGDSVLLVPGTDSTENCPYTFTWFDGSRVDSIFVSSTGVYWIEVTRPDTIYRDSINITFLHVLTDSTSKNICEGDVFEGHTASGTYVDTLPSSFGCDSIHTLLLTVIPTGMSVIDSTILAGGNVYGYTQSGIYRDTFLVPATGCDSIRILYLTVIDHNTIIRYTLNACESVMAYGTHMDYSEFTPAYPETLPCATVSAGNLHRATTEKHSCTPGFDGQAGMCVDILESCTYVAGHAKSVIVEFTIDPPADSAVQVTLLTFFEKSPNTYEWINGPSGPNEMARYYGIRILKNNVEIFRDAQRLTQLGWNLESLDFLNNPAFRCDSIAHIRIEWLPYCAFGGDEAVSVWDLDHVNIYGGCVSSPQEQPFISGTVRHAVGQGMSGVRVELSNSLAFDTVLTTYSLADGTYTFKQLEKNASYYIRCYHNEELLRGVSVTDMVNIKKHLLGITPFYNVQQLVASDINHNNSINALDILGIQKALLGIQAYFPNNTSYRFGIVPQDFGTMDLQYLKEVWHIESLWESLENLDFISIKVGDVD